MGEHVAAIDQGTTSTRFMVFDRAGREVARHQLEHEQILPRSGWVEHDPVEIWERTRTAIAKGLSAADVAAGDLAALGLTNQRETTIVWDRRTGRPYHNAVVWQDTRTDELIDDLVRAGHGDTIRERTGLQPAPYFSGGKIAWLLANVEGLRADAEEGHALFGTPDSWILWNLTGGSDGGVHATDVTNAARTMLMDLGTRSWDDDLCEIFGVPRQMLPQIRPSASPEGFGTTRADGPLGAEVPISAILGDQHAATLGQVCIDPGQAKNTYGTGNFLVLNTGSDRVRSEAGLLTTPAWAFGDQVTWALEGSIAVTGSAVQWLRDQLRLIGDAAETEALAASVPDTGGCVFVPAFSGLFAPHWRSDARGTIVGLTRFHTRAHIARATLEAICFQSRDVADAMTSDSGVALEVLRVDGGATANDLLMQLQADILGVEVSRPVVAETTALGAAYAAGLATGVWSDPRELVENWAEDRAWTPTWSDDRRGSAYADWSKAVERSLGWAVP